jgi:hypothetical protein
MWNGEKTPAAEKGESQFVPNCLSSQKHLFCSSFSFNFQLFSFTSSYAGCSSLLRVIVTIYT